MPEYSYTCEQCKKTFQLIISMTNKPPDDTVRCPTCHGKVKRFYDLFGIKFNSLGFYSTDKQSGE